MNIESPKDKKASFNELFEQALKRKGEGVQTIEYHLPFPKEEFLEFIVANKNVLLHGSSVSDMEIVEPRQANDREKVSGNKNAIYCVTDPVLPIFYAIKDKSKIQGIVESGVGRNSETGKLEYKFKIPKIALDAKQWTRGVVYIFDRTQFHPEKDDNNELSGEWTSDVPVKPIAKLEVGPEDFRFLDKVEAGE